MCTFIFYGTVVPHCRDYSAGGCGACAVHDECVWCASSNSCSSMAEALSSDCRGLVFDPPCPTAFVEQNVIVGNLKLEGDPAFGGGEFTVDGKYGIYLYIYNIL